MSCPGSLVLANKAKRKANLDVLIKKQAMNTVKRFLGREKIECV
jgi:hypothetical protein